MVAAARKEARNATVARLKKNGGKLIFVLSSVDAARQSSDDGSFEPLPSQPLSYTPKHAPPSWLHAACATATLLYALECLLLLQCRLSQPGPFQPSDYASA